jgi:hypothetical protein
MKEFLTKHGVPFVSVNVLEDKDALAELATPGIRSVPIVRRGKDWANGQGLRNVTRVTSIAWDEAQVLPAPELAARLIEIQTAAQRLFAQIPDDKLGRMDDEMWGVDQVVDQGHDHDLQRSRRARTVADAEVGEGWRSLPVRRLSLHRYWPHRATQTSVRYAAVGPVMAAPARPHPDHDTATDGHRHRLAIPCGGTRSRDHRRRCSGGTRHGSK